VIAVEMPAWLESAAPSQLGVFLGKRASQRKVGLFIRHLCRCFAEVFSDPRNQAALDVADRHEAGEASEADLLVAIAPVVEMAAQSQAGLAEWTLNRTGDVDTLRRLEMVARITREVATTGFYPDVLMDLRRAVLEHGVGGGPRKNPIARAMRPLFLEHFGNPEQPVALDPSWHSDTVLSLARHIYESRDFSVMPILADALQDAGCDNDDVLIHCRDPQQVHVRGCWVVDLVLAKT